MKTIGLIGGMSWESSLEYYRIINECVRDQLGRLYSAKILMISFNFAEIAAMQNEGNWDAAGQLAVGAAQRLENAGADVLVICSNTMHKVADRVQENVTVPLLHIVDATAEAIKTKGLRKLGLLGTKFTMEETFYKKRLADEHGLEIMIPREDEQQVVHQVIYDELCCGQVKSSSKEAFCEIIQNLAANGAEGMILGCTEIGLLVDQHDVRIPLFDTTTIHAKAVARFALE